MPDQEMSHDQSERLAFDCAPARRARLAPRGQEQLDRRLSGASRPACLERSRGKGFREPQMRPTMHRRHRAELRVQLWRGESWSRLANVITRRAIKRNERKTKRCPKCKRRKPNTAEHFGPRYQNRIKIASLDSWCRDCRRRQCREWHVANRATIYAARKIVREALRLAILSHYSNGQPACKCCEETEIKFLALDHIKGKGHRHRLEVGRGASFYLWIKKQGYPSGYRVLCHNCNQAIALYGVCPHKLR